MLGTRNAVARRISAAIAAISVLSVVGAAPSVLADEPPVDEPAPTTTEPATTEPITTEPATTEPTTTEPITTEPTSTTVASTTTTIVEPEPIDGIAVGVVAGDTVAVAAPPVPTTLVAVGQAPVPPTTVVVAVGLPPVPPTTVVVASGSVSTAVAPVPLANRARPIPTVTRDRIGDATAIVSLGLERFADLF